MSKTCHFCKLTNQWMCGSGLDGRPDDCINCGQCYGVATK